MLNVLMIASECVPLAKTGGLADVVGALPPVLQEMGHWLIVVMPRYASIDAGRLGVTPFLQPLGVSMGNTQEWCAVDRAMLASDVPVYLIQFDNYFGRDGLYHDAQFNDYPDNPRRFAFLTRAALQLCIDIGFRPDVVHVHDWQTALAPAYLKLWHRNDPLLSGAASVLTIHNVGYQGKYSASHLDYLGLGRSAFVPDILEDHGQLNFLKAGIHFADLVVAVSPTYADETRTPALGWGLAPYLSDKGDRYLGILNGVDYSQWDPATDPLIPATYTPADLSGKAVCKRELQARFGLEVTPAVPLVGVVSRFAGQKGLDVLAQAADRVLDTMLVQLVVLGSGDPGLESLYAALPARYPGRAGVHLGYDDQLAHWIEAGSDFFLMPSRYEPCGLNQLYSLKYGTLPIVRATGGLADTVEQYDQATGAGTGFKFWDLTPSAIHGVVGWAVSTFFDRPAHVDGLIRRAMAQDFSWRESAQAYLDAYHRAIQIRRAL